MASFDRTVPPGGEGQITLDLNTKGYQGKIRKTALVYTNDPKAEEVRIGLLVDVQVPIIMNPRYVLFRGVEGRVDKRVIDIIAYLDKPLELRPDRFSLEGKIEYRLEELEEGRKFRVHFSNVPEASGTFRGFLNLRTNYEEKPMLNISIQARFDKSG